MQMSEENKDPGGDPARENPKMEVSSGILTIEKPTGRRKCPKCNNENKNKIHESVDKSVQIMDYPKIYAKKYKCGLCGAEWREK